MSFSTPKGLARAAGITFKNLVAVLSNIDRNYRLVRIPKREPGSFRTLSIPKPTLMLIQRTILDHALAKAAVSINAHAYVRERSILSHASCHLGCKSLIQIDISNFFPSINRGQILEVFSRLGFNDNFSAQLTTLCMFEGSLPQGAPSSPTLSNLVLQGLDGALENFAAEKKLIYSRYADDLVLSGRDIAVDSFDQAKRIVSSFGFLPNSSKSRLMSRPSKVILTGISISSGATKVPKKFKREVRQRSFELISKGILAFTRQGNFDPFAYDRVIGQLLFWAHVEPEASFPKRYISQLKESYGRNVRVAS